MIKILNNNWALSLLAGLLLALSFPPVDLSFLSIPAFMLLLRLADRSDSFKQTAYYSYAGFVFWNLLTTYWLMIASGIAGVAAILANSVLMTIPLCLMRYFDKKLDKPVLISLLQTAAWVSYEYLHHNWDLAWPWLSIGNAWSDQISIIQYISITGHLGITFWVVFTAALAYQTVRYRTKTLAITTIASLLLLPSLSLIWFAIDTPELSADKTANVLVVQPNHDSYLDYGGMSGNGEVLDSLFSITSKFKTNETELIVWPENAIDRAVQMDNYTIKRIADSAETWETSFIVGAGVVQYYDANDAPELHHNTGNGQKYNVFNSSIFIEPSGFASRYDKANLVPIVERIPFVNFLNAIDVFGWFDWGNLAGYGKGTSPDMLETSSFITPGLVCYDSVYPGWTREFVNEGADFLTIITNDGWWGNTSGHRQHFAYARLRAIEFDRWIVRSANNGTSGIILPDGTVQYKTDYWVRTAFNARIQVKDTQTFYARFGDWLSYLCLFLTFGAWGFLLFGNKFSSGTE